MYPFQIFTKILSEILVPWQAMYDTFLASKYIATNSIEGEIVECGVYLGGMIGLMKETITNIQNWMIKHSQILSFCAFEGMADPTENDHKLFEKDATLTIKRFSV